MKGANSSLFALISEFQNELEDEVKRLQAEIDRLPYPPSGEDVDRYKELKAKIKKLKGEK